MFAIILVVLMAVAFGSGAKEGDLSVRHRVGLRVEAGSGGVESSVKVGVTIGGEGASVGLEVEASPESSDE